MRNFEKPKKKTKQNPMPHPPKKPTTGLDIVFRMGWL
jgi:hypothetical protein